MRGSRSQATLARLAVNFRRTPSEPVQRDTAARDSRYPHIAAEHEAMAGDSRSSSGAPGSPDSLNDGNDDEHPDDCHHDSSPPAPPVEKIYVLSADGSQLFLIDPSNPCEHEEPPAYATVVSPPGRSGNVTPALATEGRAVVVSGDDDHAATAGSAFRRPDREGRTIEAGNALGVSVEPTFRFSGRTRDRRQRAVVLPSATVSSSIAANGSSMFPSTTSASILPNETASDPAAAGPSRHRASTMSSLQTRAAELARAAAWPQDYPARVTAGTSNNAVAGPSSPRVRPPLRTRHHSSASGRASHDGTGQAHPGLRRNMSRATLHDASAQRGILRRAISVDERTPLLRHPGYNSRDMITASTPVDGTPVALQSGRGLMRSIFCGDLDAGEDAVETATAGAAWRRYWRPLGREVYWRPLVHLLILNFPLALLVWPFLLVGTLAGTALLITLPLGVIVWWLTLILARSAAKLEMILQTAWHAPLEHPASVDIIPHPIFHYIRPGLSDRIPTSSAPTSPLAGLAAASPLIPPPGALSGTGEQGHPQPVWEKRFIKCSYAMFLDHYSYSALSYLLLIKPLVTLFSTVALVALFPVCLVLVLPLPIYLRAARRWGKWQAGVAIDNL